VAPWRRCLAVPAGFRVRACASLRPAVIHAVFHAKVHAGGFFALFFFFFLATFAMNFHFLRMRRTPTACENDLLALPRLKRIAQQPNRYWQTRNDELSQPVQVASKSDDGKVFNFNASYCSNGVSRFRRGWTAGGWRRM
jgi:hypothetical protein